MAAWHFSAIPPCVFMMVLTMLGSESAAQKNIMPLMKHVSESSLSTGMTDSCPEGSSFTIWLYRTASGMITALASSFLFIYFGFWLLLADANGLRVRMMVIESMAITSLRGCGR